MKDRAIIMPSTGAILKTLGNNIKEARLRRSLSAALLSERAGVSRTTLWAIEKGSPTVSLGAYAAVLHGIQGMDRDLAEVAKDEALKKLKEERQIGLRKRAPREKNDE